MSQDTASSVTVTTPVKARSPRWKRGVLLAVLVTLAGGAGGGFAGYQTYIWYQTMALYHLATVQPGVLYRDGNRGMREFKHALAATKARTVVSLIDDRELNDPNKPQFLDEANYCAAHLIQYIRIPVPLGGWPTSDDLKWFNKAVSDPANQPVLVHCAQGVRRTGMFVAAYQESVLHETPAQATSEILSFGHRQRDTDDVRRFIREYDALKQTLPMRARGTSSE